VKQSDVVHGQCDRAIFTVEVKCLLLPGDLVQWVLTRTGEQPREMQRDVLSALRACSATRCQVLAVNLLVDERFERPNADAPEQG
jgi:hypothetical protein